MNSPRRLQRLATCLVLAILCAWPARAMAQEPQAPPEAPIAVRDPFVHVFSNLWTDLRHLPSRDTAVVLAVGGALALATHPADTTVTFDASHSEPADEVLDAGATIGGGYVQLGGAAATYAIARMAHSPRFTAFGADLVHAQVLNAVLTQGLKFAAQRTRPDGSSYSFPSGHASASFATATVIARHFGWKAAVPAYALAAYVGGSRLTENRHYLSDVIFGASLGIVSGQTVTLGRTRFAIAPTGGAHSVGVAMVAIGSK